jgi:hypothetical protein
MREGALSLIALAALASILFMIDFRVRDQAARLAAATSQSNLVQARAEVSATTSKLVANVRDQAMEHAPLAGFIGTAGVLLLFMFKT